MQQLSTLISGPQIAHISSPHEVKYLSELLGADAISDGFMRKHAPTNDGFMRCYKRWYIKWAADSVIVRYLGRPSRGDITPHRGFSVGCRIHKSISTYAEFPKGSPVEIRVFQIFRVFLIFPMPRVFCLLRSMLHERRALLKPRTMKYLGELRGANAIEDGFMRKNTPNGIESGWAGGRFGDRLIVFHFHVMRLDSMMRFDFGAIRFWCAVTGAIWQWPFDVTARFNVSK